MHEMERNILKKAPGVCIEKVVLLTFSKPSFMINSYKFTTIQSRADTANQSAQACSLQVLLYPRFACTFVLCGILVLFIPIV